MVQNNCKSFKSSQSEVQGSECLRHYWFCRSVESVHRSLANWSGLLTNDYKNFDTFEVFTTQVP